MLQRTFSNDFYILCRTFLNDFHLLQRTFPNDFSAVKLVQSIDMTKYFGKKISSKCIFLPKWPVLRGRNSEFLERISIFILRSVNCARTNRQKKMGLIGNAVTNTQSPTCSYQHAVTNTQLPTHSHQHAVTNTQSPTRSQEK